jgi:DNA invertase Pin-like site-specific DNA recombinase
VGVEKVFSEQTSAVGHRKALDDALEFCREGDTLIVAKLDRLARSVSHWPTIRTLQAARRVDLEPSLELTVEGTIWELALDSCKK